MVGHNLGTSHFKCQHLIENFVHCNKMLQFFKNPLTNHPMSGIL